MAENAGMANIRIKSNLFLKEILRKSSGFSIFLLVIFHQTLLRALFSLYITNKSNIGWRVVMNNTLPSILGVVVQDFYYNRETSYAGE